ncbi:MAG TPA: hypothetical protein DCY13_11375 [Verrucomicrobiales bacterium]|nr:hypothetical protein [Verrucomicrobiales bacterium]
MSLKAFHIAFVIITVLTSFVIGGLLIHAFLKEGGLWNIVGSLAAFASGVGLIYYGKYVLKKLRHISYL